MTYNMKSADAKVVPLKTRGGKPALNQNIIETRNGYVFQSYDSRIAHINSFDELVLDEGTWDYSNTTLKYLSQFLDCYPWVRKALNTELGQPATQRIGVQTLRKLIKSKTIKLVDLN